jgi:eukaryotic-like serine/threonine-protein kinase
LLEAEVGNAALAGQHIQSALSLARTRNVKIQAALAFARTGHARSARALLRELEAGNRGNTLIKYYWAPSIKAAISIREGNPQTAVSDLAIVDPYELSQAATVSASLYMYPTYIRGEAYLAADDGTAAAVEFGKVLAHHGVVQNGLLGALSRLQLARAEAMSGDLAGARQEYQDFLFLWKDADSDVPLLKQAKSEYAELH